MAVHTTVQDYAEIAGDTDGDLGRAAIWLPAAERWVARQAGRDFYDAAAPTGDASEDWKLVVSLVVAAWRRAEMAQVARLAASDSSAVKSVTETDDGVTQTITYRDPSVAVAVTSVDPFAADPRIAEIIAAYTLVPVRGMRSRLAERGDRQPLAEYRRERREW